MKKILSMSLAAILAIGLFAGCTPKTDKPKEDSSSAETVAAADVSAPGEFPIVKEKETFKVVSAQTYYITDLNTNDFYKWYEEKTNVKIEFDLIAESAMQEKVNLILASNQLPDAFLNGGISTADLVKYGEQGIFIPINDMVEKHGHFIKEVFEENERLPEAVTTPNGKIYALPAVNECFHCFYAGRAWINEQWLKNVDMEYPETTDDLYEVLKAFKEKDANGNGKTDDEIPMMGANTGWLAIPHDFLLNSFVYNDGSTRIALKNEKIEFVGNTPEFKEGLTYIKKLIDEGLLDPVSLTQTTEQFRVIAGNPESIDVGVAVGALWSEALGNDDTDPLQRSKQYVGLSPLKGPKGVRNVLTNEDGIIPAQLVITNACKNPEVLFKWGEGQYDQYTGIVAENGTEGVHWEKPTNGELGINGLPALYKKIVANLGSGSDSQNFSIPNFGVLNRTAEFRAGQAVEDEEYAMWASEPRLERETKTYFEPFRSDEAVPAIIYTAAEAEVVGKLSVAIKDYVLENIVAFLSGAKSLDKDWDSYIQEFDALELDKYLETVQTGYDRQYGKES